MLSRTLVLTLVTASILAAEPEKLAKLRGSYESAISKATAPIQKTYVSELEKLKIEFTKAGNLEAALAVDSELKLHRSATPSMSPSPTSQPTTLGDLKTTRQFGKWLEGTAWKREEAEVTGEVLHFDKHGLNFTFTNGSPAKGPFPIDIKKVGEVVFGFGIIVVGDDLQTAERSDGKGWTAKLLRSNEPDLK